MVWVDATTHVTGPTSKEEGGILLEVAPPMCVLCRDSIADIDFYAPEYEKVGGILLEPPAL